METLSQSQYQKTIKALGKEIDKMHDPQGFATYLYQHKEDEVVDMLHDRLKDAGFPDEANENNVVWELKVRITQDGEYWAEKAIDTGYIDREDIEDNFRTFFSKDQDCKLMVQHRDELDTNIIIHDSIEGWYTKKKSANAVAQKLEQFWDENEVAEWVSYIIGEDDEIDEKIRDAAVDNGYDPQAIKGRERDIPVSIRVRPKVPFTKIGEMAVHKYKPSKVESFKQGEELDDLYIGNGPTKMLTLEFQPELTADEWLQEYTDVNAGAEE